MPWSAMIKLQPQSSLEEPSRDSDSDAVEEVITAFLAEFALSDH